MRDPAELPSAAVAGAILTVRLTSPKMLRIPSSRNRIVARFQPALPPNASALGIASFVRLGFSARDEVRDGQVCPLGSAIVCVKATHLSASQ